MARGKSRSRHYSNTREAIDDESLGGGQESEVEDPPMEISFADWVVREGKPKDTNSLAEYEALKSKGEL